MAIFDKVLFIIFFICLHQCNCKEELGIPVEDEPLQIAIDYNLLKLFERLIESNKSHDEYLDQQLKNYSTVKNIEILHADEFLKIDHSPVILINVLQKLVNPFRKIDHMHDDFVVYTKPPINTTDIHFRALLEAIQNVYEGPQALLDTIYSTYVTQLVNLDKYTKGFEGICDRQKSQQQIFHLLFTNICVAEMKVYSMLKFSYKDASENDKYEEIIKLLKEEFKQRTNEVAKVYIPLMRKSSREVWRCDPKNHTEDVTYTELKQVFQKYVVNDEDINNEKNCYKTCGAFDNVQPTKCANKEDHYDVNWNFTEYSICDQQRKCEGALYDCEDYFDKFDELWICPSPLNSSRRYEFMVHGDTQHFMNVGNEIRHYGRKGNKEDCDRNITYDYREFGQTWSDLWRYCEICLCTCADFNNRNSDRFFNTRPAIADNDYVVVGARLVKKDHVLNIQIAQGKILSNGRIDQETVGWKKILDPRGIYDLQALSWKKLRAIYLEVVEVPKYHVIVGVKFSVIGNGTSPLLALKTLSKRYDFITGNLTYENVYYIESEKPDFLDEEFDHLPILEPNTLVAEALVNLTNCDVPTKSLDSSVPQSDNKKIVRLTTSDFKKDLGQTTIPFVDIQDVKPMPAVPLTSISFYHKNTEGYGGYLGIKLLTYNFTINLHQ